jgi:hypothetical protein
MTCNDVGLSKSQTTPGHPLSFLSGRRMGNFAFCVDCRKLNVRKKVFFPTAPDWRHSRHAGRRQMVLQYGPEERSLAGGSASRQQGEVCVLHISRAITVHGHVLWPLQRFCNMWVVNGDHIKMPHLRVMSRVPRWCDHDWPHISKHLINLQKVIQQFEKPAQSSIRRSANFFRMKYNTSGVLCLLRG